MMDICHSTFVQEHRIDNAKSELSCQLWSLGDYGMSVWVLCSQHMCCLEVVLIMRETVCMFAGVGIYRKFLYFPLDFSVNLKLISKYKVLI